MVPKTERATRPLTKLPEDEQPDAWREAVEFLERERGVTRNDDENNAESGNAFPDRPLSETDVMAAYDAALADVRED